MKTHLFAYGFRPNFLAAGLAAAVLVPLWAAVAMFGVPLEPRWQGVLWHAHEMTFGFVAAAIGGFLLTAVPNWTGTRGHGGWPLVALTIAWLLGRAAPFLPAGVSPWWVAAADLLYLPGVALLVAPPLFRTNNRNRPMLLVLAALTFCNATFHCYAARGNAQSALDWVHVALNLSLVLVTVIAGRIVPAFTNSGLRAQGLAVAPALPWLEWLVIGATLAIVPVDLVAPNGLAAGAVAGIAGLAHLARASRWRPLRTRGTPLVWILHVGYAWIPVGLLLKAAFLLTHVPFAASWLHALTAGALATMIVGVMTRASLGHTGRELRVGPPIVACYLLLAAAVLVRVFGASTGIDYRFAVATAAALWAAAFVGFLAVYGPILAGPRADGRPG